MSAPRFLLSFLVSATLAASAFAVEKVILDTDPSYDPDDMGCMAMLHGMANDGELEIVAVMNVFHHEESPIAISATNWFYNRKAIPVGDYRDLPKEKAPETNYDWYLARNYPAELKYYLDAPEVTDLYREILASAEPNSITILVVGTQHNIELLLKSEPDHHSPLNGIDLVAQSVKQIVTMGGNFIDGRGHDRTNWGGADALCREDRTWACLVEEQNRLTRYVINNCPVPFIASGWENGNGQFNGAEQGDVRSGQRLKELADDHIVRVAYEKHFETRGGSHKIDRHSNDQCALLYGARGAGDYYTPHIDGTITLTETGETIWEKTPDGIQGYVEKLAPDAELATLIEELMLAEVAPADETPPTAPSKLRVALTRDYNVLHWHAAEDPDQGSWVAYYNVYSGEQLIGRAHGLRYVLRGGTQPDEHFRVTAVNTNGIEGPAALLK